MSTLFGLLFWAVVFYFIVYNLRKKSLSSGPKKFSSVPAVLADPFAGPSAEMRGRVAAREQAAAPTNTPLPEHLPLKTKEWFFSRSESMFLELLESVLPAGYRVFPNVRLNDLFYITERDPQVKQRVLGRLRDKHVDFLIVSLPEHRPVAAIELDGKSHDNTRQKHRDAVKDVAFKSARLALLRLKVEDNHTASTLSRRLEQVGVHTLRQTVA